VGTRATLYVGSAAVCVCVADRLRLVFAVGGVCLDWEHGALVGGVAAAVATGGWLYNPTTGAKLSA
jgi:hypothetical protein